jgi:putative peptidoglycan lipid II flippase
MTDVSLARSSALMAMGTVASRLLGFVRTSALAGVIGIGLAADTFDVANTLPNQFYLLLAGGVLNAVLVPQITKAATHDDGGHEFVNRLLTISFAIIAAATVVITALAPFLVRLFSQGWSDEALGLATAFAFICLPQVLLYGLYTLLGQVLNARGHFAAYMWAPAVANIVAIAGLVVFRIMFGTRVPVSEWTGPMIWLLAGTATLGVAAQALVLVVPLRRIGFRSRPVWGVRGTGLGSASRVAMWTFAAIGVSQLGFIVTSKVMTRANDLLHASDQVGAGKAAYGIAFLLFMLPHSLITLSLVTALFTRMSQAAHAGRTEEVVDDVARGLKMPAVVLLPATVAAVLLGAPAVRVAFPSNSPAEASAIAGVMVAMMLGILPFGWLYLVQRVYYAYEDAKSPFYLQVVVTVVATVVNLVAAAVPPERTGVVVGLGQTLSNTVAAVLGLWLLRRRFGSLHLRSTTRLYVRLAMASVAAAVPTVAVVWVLRQVLPQDAAGHLTWMSSVVVVVVGIAVLFPVALAVAHALRVREVALLLDPVLRRVRARRGAGPSGTP